MIGAGEVWVTILVAGAGTYAIRSTLVTFATRLEAVDQRLREALRMIPAAALAALTAPAILRPQGGGPDVLDARFLAGALALVVAWRTRSLLATIVTGMVAVTALDQFALLS